MELRECNRERKEKEKERGVSESILSSFFPLPKLLPPSSLFLRLSDARAFCLACSAPRGSRFCCSGTSRSHCRRRRSGPEAELHADSSFDVDVAAAACCRVPLPATPLRPCLCFLLLFLFLPGAGAAAVSSSRPPQPGRLRRRQQRRGRPRVRGPQSLFFFPSHQKKNPHQRSAPSSPRDASWRPASPSTAEACPPPRPNQLSRSHASPRAALSFLKMRSSCSLRGSD